MAPGKTWPLTFLRPQLEHVHPGEHLLRLCSGSSNICRRRAGDGCWTPGAAPWPPTPLGTAGESLCPSAEPGLWGKTLTSCLCYHCSSPRRAVGFRLPSSLNMRGQRGMRDALYSSGSLIARKMGHSIHARCSFLFSFPTLATYQGSPAFPEWQCPQSWCHFCRSTSSSRWRHCTAWAGSRRSHRTEGGNDPAGHPQSWPPPGT